MRESYIADPIRTFSRNYVVDSNGCWIWQKSPMKTGYGRLCIGNEKFVRVHRWSYWYHKGPIKQGLDVMHSCDNRMCVNPDHLSLGTRKQNMEDCTSKMRQSYGVRNGHAILNDEQVMEILRIYAAGGISRAKLGKQYGVSASTIQGIVERRTWKHI